MKLRRRTMPLCVLAVTVALVTLFSLSGCEAQLLDRTSLVGTPCHAQSDCPAYLTCASETCRARCANEGATCETFSGAYGTCRSGACITTGSESNGTSGGSGSPGTSSSCKVGGEVLRRDFPATVPTGAALLFDETHAYLGGVFTDNLGNPVYQLRAGALDGSGSLSAVRSVPSPSSSSSPALYRSDKWLYLQDSMGLKLERLPAPPDVNSEIEDVTLPQYASVVAATKTRLFVSTGGALFRAKGDTAQTEMLLDHPESSILTVTSDRVYWLHGTNGGGGGDADAGDAGAEAGADGGATGPRPHEIMYASIETGPAVATGALLPDYAQAIAAVVGTSVLFVSPNGTLLKLDISKVGATPVTVRGPSSSGANVLSSGDGLYVQRMEGSSSCWSLYRVNPSTGGEELVAGLNDGQSSYPYDGFRIRFAGSFVYWINGTEIRRAPR